MVVNARRMLVSQLVLLHLHLLLLLLLGKSHGLSDSIRLNHELWVLQKSLAHGMRIDNPSWRKKRIGGDLLHQIPLARWVCHGGQRSRKVTAVHGRKRGGKWQLGERLPVLSAVQLVLELLLLGEDRVFPNPGGHEGLGALLLSQLA
jgi:hypothetical protein